MLLSGQETPQTSRFNYLNLIKGSLGYQITNRIDKTPGLGDALSWGESVLIGLYSTTHFTAGDEIVIFGDTSVTWTVYAVEDHWILVSFYDVGATTNFSEYMDLQNPTTVADYTVIWGPMGNLPVNYNIRKVDLHKNYKNLNVELRALDTLDEVIDFGDMYMIADTDGNVIVYNLSVALFNNIEEKNIDNVLFDLCIQGDEYRPIIRGLTFVEKVKDLNYLVFTYNTNFGKQYILFTTNSTLSSFAVYPDIHMSENLYNNVSNDIRTPPLYMNMMNDIYSSELISMYADGDLITDTISTVSWAKEVFEGDVIYGDGVDYTIDSTIDYSAGVELVTLDADLYIISYDEKFFLYTASALTPIAQKYNLNNLLLEFDATSAVEKPSAVGTDYTARILQVYYTGVTNELLYMTYFPAMTFYNGVAKTFRIII